MCVEPWLAICSKDGLAIRNKSLRDEDIRVAELRNLNTYKKSISKIKLWYPNSQARDEP